MRMQIVLLITTVVIRNNNNTKNSDPLWILWEDCMVENINLEMLVVVVTVVPHCEKDILFSGTTRRRDGGSYSPFCSGWRTAANNNSSVLLRLWLVLWSSTNIHRDWSKHHPSQPHTTKNGEITRRKQNKNKKEKNTLHCHSSVRILNTISCDIVQVIVKIMVYCKCVCLWITIFRFYVYCI